MRLINIDQHIGTEIFPSFPYFPAHPRPPVRGAGSNCGSNTASVCRSVSLFSQHADTNFRGGSIGKKGRRFASHGVAYAFFYGTPSTSKG
jgi:hypothetical protein